MRGAPQSGLSWLMVRMRSRTSAGAAGRPPTDATVRLLTPVETEAAPMPAHQGLGFEDHRSSEQRRKQPVEPDEDQPIRSAQPEPGGRGPLQHEQLLAEKCHLGL